MEEKEKLKILKEKYGLTKIGKLALHDDSDGIASGVLLTYVFKTAEVMSPENFGEVEDSDVCVDMKPIDPMWSGLCIDHHPDHPKPKDRKYKLVWDEIPTSGIVYKLFKDFIPKEQHWKMAIGMSGDGQADSVPVEIWRRFPMLLCLVQSGYEYRGNVRFYPIPMYMKVVSAINAACKIPDKWYSAYTVFRTAEDPIDVISDDSLIMAKKLVADERKRLIKEYPTVDINDLIRVWPIESQYKLERALGWRSEQIDHKTTMVVNKTTGRISIRGVLAMWLYQELSKLGYSIGGHSGFGGGVLSEDQDFLTLIKDLKNLKL